MRIRQNAPVSVWLLAAALAGGGATTAQGQDLDAAAERAALRAEAEARLVDELERRAVREVDRRAVEADARAIAGALSDEQLDDLLRGRDLVRVIAEPRDPSEATGSGGADADRLERATAKALGNAESELLFVPVSPCRILDTRFGGGPLAPSETRSYEVAGTTGFESQGGQPGGCGIPLGAASPLAPSVVLNLIAVGPAGPGHLEAWEFGQPVPIASVINYANASGLNIANGIIVPISGVSTTDKDLHIRANINGTHVVADVTGYFTRFPIEQFQSSLKPNVIEGASGAGGTINLADGGCKQAATCTVTSPIAGKVLAEAWAQVVVNHASGTTDRFVMAIETTDPVTCSADDSVDASDYEIPAALGSNTDTDFTLSHARVFNHAAGATVTYRLSGRMVEGANNLDALENSRLVCTFIPN